MFGIKEISKYRTSDGMEFEDNEAAMVHEIELATKSIKPGDLIVKDGFGNNIELKELWWRVGTAFYVEAHSEAALNFFNEAARAEGLETIDWLGVYRYYEEGDHWITPQEEVNKLRDQWVIYNKELKFTFS